GSVATKGSGNISDREDSTRVLGGGDAAATVAFASAPVVRPSYRLRVEGPDGFAVEEILTGSCWVLGRTGSSGRGLPPGCRKLDLDLRGTVSREQVKLEISDDL